MSDRAERPGLPQPDWVSRVRERLRALRADPTLPGGGARLDEIAEEIAAHLEAQYDDAVRQGTDPAVAEKTILETEADWAALSRAIVDPLPRSVPSTRERIMESTLQDVRFALRTLIARPLFSLSIVFLLALGIGANTALFTVVNGVLFSPLPYAEPERLVAVTEANRRDGGELDISNLQAANLRDLRERNIVLQDAAGYWQGPGIRTDGEEPEQLALIRTTHNLMAVLGIEPVVGALFPQAAPEAAYTAMLDHGYWERRFAADPDVVGRALTLDGEAYTVVGVTPPDFRFLERADAYVVGPQAVPSPPIDLGDDYQNDRTTGYMEGVGRLLPGVTLDRAVADVDRVGRELEAEFPDEQAGRTFTVLPLHQNLVGGVQPALLLLLGAVGFVLLIACANVANLLLARASDRRKEIALRTALGASRSRVVRQLLTESLMLSVCGGGLGALLAVAGLEPLRGFLPTSIPRIGDIGVDAAVLGFTVLITVVTGAVFGLAPAWQSSGTDAQSVIRADSRAASSGKGRARLRDGLVVAEIALASVLLIGAGLMSRSLMELQSRDPGFEPRGVLTLRLALPQTKYDTSDKIAAFYWQLVDEIGALPGVESAATVLGIPFSGTHAGFSYLIWGEEPPPPGQEYEASFQAVSPGYFETLGIPMLAGRDFTRADTADVPEVAIVSEALVRRHFPDVDPLTQSLQFDTGPDGTPIQIVGVVGSTRHLGYDGEIEPEVYLTFEQMTFPFTSVVVRTAGDPADLTAIVRGKVLELDPDQPVYRIQPLEGLMFDTVAQPRFSSRLLGGFAAVALLLAAVGVFGVISYSVSQRTREIGIRMALGADAGNVLTTVMAHAATLVGLGIVGGLAAAAGMARMLEHLWVEISALDPTVFVAVPCVLAAVSLLATWLPARRATRVDPVEALRAD